MGLRKFGDLGDVFGRSAVVCRVFVVSQVAAALVGKRDRRFRVDLRGDSRTRSQPERHLDLLVGMHRPEPPRAPEGETMAPFHGNSLHLRCHELSPLWDWGVSLHGTNVLAKEVAGARFRRGKKA
jgi:hypothetical protein